MNISGITEQQKGSSVCASGSRTYTCEVGSFLDIHKGLGFRVRVGRPLSIFGISPQQLPPGPSLCKQ